MERGREKEREARGVKREKGKRDLHGGECEYKSQREATGEKGSRRTRTPEPILEIGTSEHEGRWVGAPFRCRHYRAKVYSSAVLHTETDVPCLAGLARYQAARRADQRSQIKGRDKSA